MPYLVARTTRTRKRKLTHKEVVILCSVFGAAIFAACLVGAVIWVRSKLRLRKYGRMYPDEPPTVPAVPVAPVAEEQLRERAGDTDTDDGSVYKYDERAGRGT